MKIRCYTLLLAVMTAAASLCYGDITLARNGKALYTIVERPDAARLEKAAIKDLKLYLDRITGGDFKIGESDSRRIFIGVPAPGDNKPLEKAERRIKAVNGDIYIYGESTDSAAWGIYDLLEEHIGCRWYTARGVEKVPSDPNLTIPELDYTHTPSFRRFETVSVSVFRHNKGITDFLRRRRIHITPDKIEGDDDYLLGVPLHTFCKYIPSGKVPKGKFVDNIGDAYKYFADKKYFETNPEWFSMDAAGNRVWNIQLCLSNKELRKEFLKNLEIVIKNEYKGGDAVIAVDVNDRGEELCYCSDCQDLVARYGTKGGPLYDFLIELGGIFAEKYPGITIRSLAYLSTKVPPNCDMPENVMMWYAPLHDHDYLKNYEKSSNPKGLRDLKAHAKRSKALWKWFYISNHPIHVPEEPIPLIANIQVVADNLRIIHKYNVRCIMTEMGLGVGGTVNFNELRIYLASRLIDRLDRAEQAEIREFMAACYGKAAGKMYDYLQELEKCGSEDDCFMGWKCRRPLRLTYITPERLIRWSREFDEMEKMVADDPAALTQVKIARINLDQTVIGSWVNLADTDPGTYTLEAFEAAKKNFSKTIQADIDYFIKGFPESMKKSVESWQRNRTVFYIRPLKSMFPVRQSAPEAIRPLPPELAKLPANRVKRFPYLPQDGTKALADPEGAFGTSLCGAAIYPKMNFKFDCDGDQGMCRFPVMLSTMKKMPGGFNYYYLGTKKLFSTGGVSTTVVTDPHAIVRMEGFRGNPHEVDLYISMKYGDRKIWIDELLVVDVGD